MRSVQLAPALIATLFASTAAAQTELPAPPPPAPAPAPAPAGAVDSDRANDDAAAGPFYKPSGADQLMAPPPPAPPPAPLAPTRFSGWLESHAFIGGHIKGTSSGAAIRYADPAGVGLIAGVMFNNRMFFVGIDGGRNFSKKIANVGGGGLYVLYPHFETRIMSPLTEKHVVLGVGTSATGLRYASACKPGGGTGFTAELRVLTFNVWTSFFAATDNPFSVTLGALAEVGIF